MLDHVRLVIVTSSGLPWASPKLAPPSGLTPNSEQTIPPFERQTVACRAPASRSVAKLLDAGLQTPPAEGAGRPSNDLAHRQSRSRGVTFGLPMKTVQVQGWFRA